MRLHRLITLFLVVAASGCRLSEDVTGPSELVTATLKSREHGRDAAGAVYVMSNDPGGNAVLAFARSADGRLGAPVSYPTGGAGTGAGLGNQGGLALSPDGRWLFAVNAGSDEISAFRVLRDRLQLADRIASGGSRPVSLTVHDELLYVLNAGGTGNIAGFRIREGGRLKPIPGSVRPLSDAAAMAAQIGFSPDGDQLVVTERATNRISVYTVGSGGSASGPRVQAAAGVTPFGFGFDRRGTLVVSEAFGGAAGASAVSSYRIGRRGGLHVVSPSVPTTETAACWIAVSGNDRFAYSTNAGSASITGYAIRHDGALERLAADGVTATTGTGPSDLAFGAEGRFLFVRNGGSNSISAYAWRRDGSLMPLAGATGLPAGANGIAAR